MFESTLESQGRYDGQRTIGALSAAALAHVVIGLAIVAATALIVPPVKIPDAPSPVFVFVPRVHLDGLAEPPVRPPAPKKGTDVAKPGRTPEPPRVTPEVPKAVTPERLPDIAPESAPDGPPGSGDGTQGDPTGSASGIPGGTGDGEAGPGVEHGLDPVEVTGDMARPVLLVKVEPSYPLVARRAGLSGRVTVRAVIAEDGRVESVEVFASTNPLFNEAAVDAVRQWRYRPALMGGRPVRVYLSVVVDFLVR